MTESLRLERIVFAFDARSHADPRLAAALRLAAGSRPDLEAVFVEDQDLVNLAALPFASEVGLSAGLRQLDPTALRTSLRAHAEELRRGLEAMARSGGRQLSFSTVQGRLTARLQALLEEASVAVLSRGAAAATATRGPVTGQLVAVPFGGGEGDARALIVAAELAVQVGGELMVLLAPDAARRLEWRRRADALLAARGVRRHFLGAAPEAGELLAALRHTGADYLVLAAPLSTALERLLQRLSCPLLLVR